MSTLHRRLTKLEDEHPLNQPYFLCPEPCKTTEQWLAQLHEERDGKGHHVLGPLPKGNGRVRYYKWVRKEVAETIIEDFGHQG